MMPKITKFHVDVKPFYKMRVKLASEVFSNSVSVAMSAFVAMGKLSSQAENTADFFYFMDRLFDSFNPFAAAGDIRCHARLPLTDRRRSVLPSDKLLFDCYLLGHPW
jgi:hypothetical protein